MIVNHSTGFPNWSQLKNYQEPYSTCNVTSCISAAQCAGFDIMALRRSSDPEKRPADDLYNFLHTDDDCLALRHKLCHQAGLDPNYPPNELMEVLALGLGKWLKAPQSVEIHFGLPIKMIMQHVIQGGTGILHGHYPTQSKDIDHMNAIVGLDFDGGYNPDGTAKFTLNAFIIDDPYGDYRKLYALHMGDDIRMPVEDVNKYIKECGNSRNKDIILVHRRET